MNAKTLIRSCCMLVFAAGALVASGLETGWAERDITPSLDGKKIPLAGLCCIRDAANVHSRLKFTCCVMRSGEERVFMGSIDPHIARIGDVAFASNPFELYLPFGQVVKAWSAAKQTFLIGKCSSSGHVPTERSEKAAGCSGGVNVGRIGRQGGFAFCDEVVKGVAELFGEKSGTAQ